MRRRVLIVDGERFVPLGDVDELERRIVAAARDGGGFVSFATEARVVELFITPALSIVIEDIEDADPPA